MTPDTPQAAATTSPAKSILASKSVWMVIIAVLIVPILHKLGVSALQDTDTDALATGLASLAAVIGAILARRNTTPVKLPGSGSAVPLLAFAFLCSAFFPVAGCSNLTPAQTQQLKDLGWGLVRTAITVGLAVAGEQSPAIAAATPALESAVNTAASDPAATQESIAKALTAAAETAIKDPALRAQAVAAIKAQLVKSADTPAAGPADAIAAANARGVAALL